MQQRRYVAATWTSINEVLLQGELGVELDTGKWKIGDGSTAWTGLPYQPWTAGITAQVNAAVAGVVSSAPGALDTLNELAAALGNDQNFASTVTTALAGKASTTAVADAAAAVQAYAIQRSNHTGTQAASTITGLAAVATSGLKADVGLGEVDNTSDLNKPVSTAQAAAISAAQTAASGSAAALAIVFG